MEKRHYKRTAMCYLSCFVILCCTSVKALEYVHFPYPRIKKNDSRLLTKEELREAKSPSDNRKLARVLRMEKDHEEKDADIPSLKESLVFLYEEAASENGSERMMNALSLKNLNKISQLHGAEFYDIIAAYLKLEKVSPFYKKELKKRIITSDIYRENEKQGCISLNTTLEWSLFCCGAITNTAVYYLIPKYTYIVGGISLYGLLAYGAFTRILRKDEMARRQLSQLCKASEKSEGETPKTWDVDTEKAKVFFGAHQCLIM